MLYVSLIRYRSIAMGPQNCNGERNPLVYRRRLTSYAREKSLPPKRGGQRSFSTRYSSTLRRRPRGVGAEPSYPALTVSRRVSSLGHRAVTTLVTTLTRGGDLRRGLTLFLEHRLGRSQDPLRSSGDVTSARTDSSTTLSSFRGVQQVCCMPRKGPCPLRVTLRKGAKRYTPLNSISS